MSNTNCLEGWRCPECGQDKHFKVTALATFDLYDDGTEEIEGCEYDEFSLIRCPECGRNGVVGEFLAENEDASSPSTFCNSRLQNKLILRNLARDITSVLLQNADKWPDNWDGLEMRGLLLRAVEFECKGWMAAGAQLDGRSRRGKAFNNTWVCENLY